MVGAGMEVIADGLRFPEGPVALPDGSVVLTEIAAGRITRIAPDGSKSTVAETGGGPNGLALGPDGTLYLFEGAHLVRLDQTANRLVTVLPEGARVLPAGRMAQPLELRQPRLRVGADGVLYIANYLLDQVFVLKL